MIDFTKPTPEDRADYLRMVKEFYSTDAVLFHVADSHFEECFEELLRSDEYTFCHIFRYDGEAAGYALIAKTYSQEAGGMVWWIEEIYVLPEYRGKGIGSAYFDYLFSIKPENVKRMRLEVERENEGAVALYKRLGFDFLDYDQMYLEL